MFSPINFCTHTVFLRPFSIRTFLFLYVFTVPFVMLGDESSLFAHCFAVFLLTYGFVGLELVAIEMDNPFGDDDNDFDNL